MFGNLLIFFFILWGIVILIINMGVCLCIFNVFFIVFLFRIGNGFVVEEIIILVLVRCNGILCKVIVWLLNFLVIVLVCVSVWFDISIFFIFCLVRCWVNSLIVFLVLMSKIWVFVRLEKICLVSFMEV